MKKIEFDSDLLSRIRSLTKSQRLEIGSAIAEAQKAFGSPHRHAGLGLRKLSGAWFEIRLGLGQRLIFKENRASLYFRFIGNHDEVRRFLKSI